MKKKIIIITLGMGLIGFSGMFALAWFTKPAIPVQPPIAAEAVPNNSEPAFVETSETSAAADRIASMRSRTAQQLTDRELQTLIYEVREKIKEYNLKLQELDVREKRLQIAQDDLNKNIEEMADLRVELAAAVASLKNEQDKLLQNKMEVENNERENLISIAATYDKMDAESAGKILMNMVKNPNVGNSAEDAVKILYYMTDRTKAKVLASMAEAEPDISAYICQRLKRIVTVE